MVEIILFGPGFTYKLRATVPSTMKVGLLCLAWLGLAAAITLQSDDAERPTTKVVKLLKTMQVGCELQNHLACVKECVAL